VDRREPRRAGELPPHARRAGRPSDRARGQAAALADGLDRDGVLSEDSSTSGWLPPQAPGGRPPPQFESAPPDEEPEPAPPPAVERPIVFQKPATQSNGAATTSLILGILGITLVLLTLGAGFLFSIPASIAAWVTGAQGRKRVARGQTTYGDGLAHAGVVLGIAGVVLGVVGMIVWIVLIASGLDLEELRRDLEERSR
jgi:hypothetical protein